MKPRWLTILLVAGLAGAPVTWCAMTWLEQHRLETEIDSTQRELQLLRDRVRRLHEAPPAPTAETVVEPWALADSAQVASHLHELGTLGERSSLEIESVQAPPSSTSGRLGFQVHGSGSPEAICDFLSAVEAHRTVFVIEDGVFSAREDGSVGFALTLASYYRTGGPR